ncbi:mitochondrial distribution/morphology family 35/apoptosis [Hyaloraphidium curvatum]|nr:mitochondrial distribution/morphology family 35/apoptosis [Hyaloraphidium curvatum]
MASLSPECTGLKKEYDDCFNKWYADKFLRGDVASNDCKDLFDRYRACVWNAVREKKLDTVIEEARNEAPFADKPAGDKA